MSLVTSIVQTPHTFTVVGVSPDPTKYRLEVFETLTEHGHSIYQVNPKYEMLDGLPCYPSLDVLPEVPDVVVAAVPPAVTKKMAESCHRLGNSILWMSPGTESEQAIDFRTSNSLREIHGFCPVFVLTLPPERWNDLP